MQRPAPLSLFTSLLMASAARAYRIKVDFHDGDIKTFDVPRGNLTADELLAGHRTAVVFGEDSHFDKRQVCTSYTRDWYELVGDGNPHQNFKITQVANTMVSCPATVAEGHSHTSEWSFSVGTDVVFRDMTFASLGLGVSESNTQSVEFGFGCEEGSGITEVCV